MLQYPSILGVKKLPKGFPCFAFYKYDGSNLRFEWSQKKGWSKFGSRTQLIDINNEIFGKGIEIFQNQMADIIIERIKYFYPKQFKSIERITVFAEFYGENSFAGTHFVEDMKDLKLFDVFLFKKGFLSPERFIEVFGDWDKSAEVVYTGKLDDEFIEKIRYNTLDIKLNEGVICKGSSDKIQFKTLNQVWMTKIKTFDFINKLKCKFPATWNDFAE
jgi:hypothetical protein